MSVTKVVWKFNHVRSQSTPGTSTRIGTRAAGWTETWYSPLAFASTELIDKIVLLGGRQRGETFAETRRARLVDAADRRATDHDQLVRLHQHGEGAV